MNSLLQAGVPAGATYLSVLEVRLGSVASEPLSDGCAPVDLVGKPLFGFSTTKHEGESRPILSPVCDGANGLVSHGFRGSCASGRVSRGLVSLPCT